jgi:transcriptional regulator with XRE-family HTH domain
MQTKKQQSVVFCEKLKVLMKDKKLKQHHLVSKLGVTQAAVSRWYNGSIPNPDILPELADFLGVSVDYLLEKQQPVVMGDLDPEKRSSNQSNFRTRGNLTPSLTPIKKVKISALREDTETIKAVLEKLAKAVADMEKRIGELEKD